METANRCHEILWERGRGRQKRLAAARGYCMRDCRNDAALSRGSGAFAGIIGPLCSYRAICFGPHRRTMVACFGVE